MTPFQSGTVQVSLWYHIIKIVMSSASEAELGVIFITAKDMVSMRNTLEEMRWPQPKVPIKTENSTAAGVVNNKIVPRKIKVMDPVFILMGE